MLQVWICQTESVVVCLEWGKSPTVGKLTISSSINPFHQV